MDSETILQALRQHGYRVTRPRRAIALALAQARGWLRAEEVLARARDRCPGLGLVTVYRALALFTELGFARRVHLEDGCHGYAAAQPRQEPQAICRVCRAVVHISAADLRPLLRRAAAHSGYQIESLLVEFTGLCPRCQGGEDQGIRNQAAR